MHTAGIGMAREETEVILLKYWSTRTAEQIQALGNKADTGKRHRNVKKVMKND